jgi:DNA repair/transcription protein MET18/MMS19
MASFHAVQGTEILRDICKLAEDFRNLPPGTRLTAYELIHTLVTNNDVASDLEYTYGPTCGFMVDLFGLCRHERDPASLLKWFSILKTLLSHYSPSREVVEEVFNVYSAYFPISLRASNHPSGITADDLKASLRDCFSAHHKVARLAIPFLIQKLDQGDGVTVNVKVRPDVSLLLNLTDNGSSTFYEPYKRVSSDTRITKKESPHFPTKCGTALSMRSETGRIATPSCQL